jgi:hypothetical protein
MSLEVLLGSLFLATVMGVIALARAASPNSTGEDASAAIPWAPFIFAVLVAGHVLLALAFLRPGSPPDMDVYTFQAEACRNLIHGIDPFGATQADIYSPNQSALLYGRGLVIDGRVKVGFQYPPLTLLWALPGYLLGDLRLSYVLAIILSAGSLFALCRGTRGLWLIAILLFSPLTLTVESLGWTEPLTLMTLSAATFAAVRKKPWLPVALGLFLASKQYNLIVVPLIAYFIQPFAWKAYFRLVGFSMAVAVVTIVPFAMWNPRALWRDLILFHLAQPFRISAVSFAVPFPWIMKAGPLIVLGFLVWALRIRNRSAATLPAAYGVALLLFFVTAKQAFANYYFLIGQAFLLSAAALNAAAADPSQKSSV